MSKPRAAAPLELLKLIVKPLADYQGHFAIAGGFAASFYRTRPRLTNDVDIAFSVGSAKQSQKIAEQIIKAIGFEPASGWIAGLPDRGKKSVALVIGRPNKEELESTIDFLLPVLPWIDSAVQRGQNNLIDYGFRRLPTVTPEDLIIAKAFALSIQEDRFQDLDDIKEIFLAKNDLDVQYLVAQFERHKLFLPKTVEKNAPKALIRVSKSLRQST